MGTSTSITKDPNPPLAIAACSLASIGAPVHSAAMALQIAGGSGKNGKEATIVRASCTHSICNCKAACVNSGQAHAHSVLDDPAMTTANGSYIILSRALSELV